MKKLRSSIAMVLCVMMIMTLFIGPAPAVSANSGSGDTTITDLTTNYLKNPLGIETGCIAFSWAMDSDAIGQTQKSYKIDLYKVDDLSTAIWTTDVVESGFSVGIPYNGSALALATEYCWKVTVWDLNDEYYTSDFAYFETGVTGLPEWTNAQFIARSTTANNAQAPVFRTERNLAAGKSVKSARLYAIAAGVYTAYINGQRVGLPDGDSGTRYLHMAPGQSTQNQTIHWRYQVYDVTALLGDSESFSLAIEAGLGWRNIGGSSGRPGIKAMLRVEYTDGTFGTFSTSTTGWRATTDNNAPVTGNGIYWGEAYDARLDVALGNYKNPGYTEPSGKWEAVANLTSGIPTSGAANGGNAEPVAVPNSNGFLLYERERPAQSITLYTNITPQVVGSPVGGTGAHYTPITNKIIVDEYYANEAPAAGTVYADSPVKVIKSENLYGDGITLKAGQTMIVDLGVNHAGVPNFTAQASSGTKITMLFAEILNDEKAWYNSAYADNSAPSAYGNDGPEGTVFRKNLRGARTTFEYWFAGTGVESYVPRNTYYGYRYISVKADGDMTVYGLSSIPVSSDYENTTSIETNNEDVNKLYDAILWGQMSNMFTNPTDCAQRNERLGWTGDTVAFAKTSLYTFDNIAFMEAYQDMVRVETMTNGSAGWQVPGTTTYNFGWGELSIVLPWTLYEQTGNVDMLRKNFPSMVRFTNYVDSLSKNRLVTGDTSSPRHPDLGPEPTGQKFGDWCALQGTSVELFADLFYAYGKQVVAQAAEVVGDDAVAEACNAQLERTKALFLQKHVVKDQNGKITVKSSVGTLASQNTAPKYKGGGVLEDNTQTSILWMLKLGFYADEEMKNQLIDLLVESIRHEDPSKDPAGSLRAPYGTNTLATGFHGTYILNPILTQFGQGEVAYDLFLQDEIPSWLGIIKNGGTSMWERWNGYDKENGFGHVEMNSFNHYSRGAVAEWMIEYMSGISPNYDTNIGFKNIVLQPTPDTGKKYNDQDRINSVNGSYKSLYGNIVSNWKADGAYFNYECTIPANTTATLYLPTIGTSTVMANGVPVNEAEGVEVVGMTTHNGLSVLEVKLLSGSYEFGSETGTTLKLANPAVTEYEANQPFDVIVTTASDVTKVKIVNEVGNTIGKIGEVITKNADGTKSYRITLMIGTPGELRTISAMVMGRIGDYQYVGANLDVKIIPASPAQNLEDMISASVEVTESVVNTPFTVTVVTSKDITKVKIVGESGSTIGTLSSSAVTSGNTKIWTISIKVGTKGNRTFTALGAASTGGYGEKGKSFDIKIT